MLTLISPADSPLRVATWEDLSVGLENGKWASTSCCRTPPVIMIPVPFQHVAWMWCGGCVAMLPGIAVSEDSRMPDPKYLKAVGDSGLFAVAAPGKDNVPQLRCSLDKIVEIVVDGEAIWKFRIATEKEVADWKRREGKGDL